MLITAIFDFKESHNPGVVHQNIKRGRLYVTHYCTVCISQPRILGHLVRYLWESSSYTYFILVYWYLTFAFRIEGHSVASDAVDPLILVIQHISVFDRLLAVGTKEVLFVPQFLHGKQSLSAQRFVALCTHPVLGHSTELRQDNRRLIGAQRKTDNEIQLILRVFCSTVFFWILHSADLHFCPCALAPGTLHAMHLRLEYVILERLNDADLLGKLS